MADKPTLRKVYLEKRKFLSTPVWAARNNDITQLLMDNMALNKVKTLHLFLPISQQKEVDTWAIMDAVKSQYPGIRFAIPKVTSERQLQHFVFTSPEQLKPSRWGVPEPVTADVVAPEEIDMVLVPLIAFDRLGHRIGYGKGYYDNFLVQCRPDTVKVGLSLSPPLDKIPYLDPHDIPSDFCVNHKKCYRFS